MTDTLLPLLLRMMPDPVLVVDQQGRIVEISPEALELFGYSEEELLGQRVEILIPESSRAGHERLRESFMTTSERRRMGLGMELRGRRKDGVTIPIDIALSPLEGGSGGVIAAIRDVTEFQRVVEAERRGRVLANVARAANAESGLEAVFKVALTEIARLTGWPVGHAYLRSPEQDDLLVSSTIWYLEDPERFEQLRAVSELAEFRIGVGLPGRVLESGDPAWIMDITVDENFPRAGMIADLGVKGAFAFPVLVGDDVRAVLEFFFVEAASPNQELLDLLADVGRDLGYVLERIEVRGALGESEEQFRSLVEGANSAIVLIDAAGRVRLWNPAAERTFGWTHQEAVGSLLSELLVPPQHRTDHEEGLARFAKTGHGPLIGNTVEVRALRKDGEEIPVELSLSRIRLKDEWHAIGILKDITDRKRSERELIDARREAESASRAKSSFLANMSHEIRTPMTAIMGFAQLLERGGNLTSDQLESVRTIKRSSDRLLSILNSILQMSQIESGETRLVVNTFDLPDMLRDIEHLFALAARERGIQLVVLFPDDIPIYLRTDESKVRQILINLVDNAVKFTTEGGVVVRTEVVNRGEDAIQLAISVEDTGPGIPRQDMEEIFRAFGQGIGAVGVEGTGLGLPISRSFARMLGGDLTLTTELGKGSRFTVDMRAEIGTQAEVTRRSRQSRIIGLASTRPPRVLVVDDVKENRDLLVAILSTVGFVVDTCESGEEAVRVFGERPFDIVLMDVRMPGMDGLEATRRIKQMRGGQETPVVAVTASVLREDQHEAFDAGAEGFISKPFKEHEIFEIVASLIDLEYVYAEDDGPEEIERDASEVTREAVNELSDSVRERLRLALLDADLDRFMAVLDGVAGGHTALCRSLGRMAQSFEYHQLGQLLLDNLNEEDAAGADRATS